MKCACLAQGGANDTQLVLCDLHAREYHRRLDEMRKPDDNAVWNAALDAVMRDLVNERTNLNPIDEWIASRISLLRKR